MQFDIITIFPSAFDSYFSKSIISRAIKKRLIKIKIHNLRDFTNDKRKTVDDKPYGGGVGMIFMVEPILKVVSRLRPTFVKTSAGKQKYGRASKNKKIKRKIILLSAKGEKFDQKMAKRFSKLDQLILISGHYEGVDERVAKYIADEEISIGDYVLTGGEVPTMVIVDAVTRLLPGVIRKESLAEESFSDIGHSLEYPQYTRPAIFDASKYTKKKTVWKVPKVLLSGNHKGIEEWRTKNRKSKV